MTIERYNEIVDKLNEFLARHGRSIQCWWLQEIDWTNGLINNGQGPSQNDHEQQVQADITAFLVESGFTAREMYDWSYEAAEQAGQRTEAAMEASWAEYERRIWNDAFGHQLTGDDEDEVLDPYSRDGMGH